MGMKFRGIWMGTKIDVLKEDKTNLLEKVRYLESEHHSLLRRIMFSLKGWKVISKWDLSPWSQNA